LRLRQHGESSINNVCRDDTGLLRSTDRGVTWTRVISGNALAIAADPNDPNRFYATVQTSQCQAVADGVFTSADMGASWESTSSILPPLVNLNGAKLSVSADGSRVWSGLIVSSELSSISFSDNQGVTWTMMEEVDELTDAGFIHFSMLASPTKRNEVYVGGGAQPLPSTIGAIALSGRLFRGDATVTGDGVAPSLQWEHMTDKNIVPRLPGGGTAGGSGPHADSRDMELRADGMLLEGNDGGIVVRSKPGDNTGDWFGLCGNMQAFETHSVAYEPIRRTLLFGNQDTGTIMGTLGNSSTFMSAFIADGNAVMIDFTTDQNQLFLYFGIQYYTFFFRQAYDKTTGSLINKSQLSLPDLSPLKPGFLSVVAMNPANQKEFVVAIENRLAITSDRGDTFLSTRPITAEAITSITFSGANSILFVASTIGGIATVTRCSGCCSVVPTCGAAVRVLDASFLFRLAVDPTNNSIVFAISIGAFDDFRFPKLFSSVDGGASWRDHTVPGSLLDTASLGASVTVIAKGAVNTVAVGTSNGVLVPSGAGWKRLAPGLPKVAIAQMVYEPMDDTLVVALFGRGVWFLRQASAVASGMRGTFVDGDDSGFVGLSLVPVSDGDLVPPVPYPIV
jgi:hypothetical protein